MIEPQQAHDRLLDAYGPQGWWPASSRAGVAGAWEVMVGAVLVQHTRWANVVRAIVELEEADAMSPHAIHTASDEQLIEWVRPAGTPSVKAERLHALATMVVDDYGGSADRLLEGVAEFTTAMQRREQLLAVRGVGPETADAILLYAGAAPVFVVDAYKRRVMRRHGWGDADAPYDEVAAWWREGLPNDPVVYAQTHALLVRVGAERCKKSKPLCEGCPLQAMLPSGGPCM